MFDALTMAAIADELSEDIVRGRVQQIRHVDPLTVALEIYAGGTRRWLTLSASAQDARLIRSVERPAVDADIVSPLSLLLRKYVRGARVLAVHQPRFERMIQISVALAQFGDDEDADVELEVHELVLELMGRHSNLILVDESGRIRDAIKRVTPSMSRVRPILPGNDYVPPPPQDKLDPFDARPTDLLEIAASNQRRLDRWLVSTLFGVSPIVAREIAYRSELASDLDSKDLTVASVEALIRTVRRLLVPLQDGSWSPRLYVHDGGATFSAIPLLHLEDRADVTTEACSSVLDAGFAASQYGSPSGGQPDRHAARRARLVAEIERARNRVERQLDALARQLDSGSKADDLRINGEMIYAYIWMIEPGMNQLETPDGMTIRLDPDKSPQENAQDYFDRYRKAQSAAERIPKRRRLAKRKLDFIRQLELAAQQAESYDDIESVRIEWQSYAAETKGVGKASNPGGSKPSSSARRPRRYDLKSGAIIWIGRTGRQNDTVTFDIGQADDLWIHARDMPGAHVILRPPAGQDASQTDILTAAGLAAHYSAGRNATRVPIDVTERRNVRKIKGAGPGMVTYQNEYTIDVEPQPEEALELSSA